MKILIVSGHEGYTGAVVGNRIEAVMAEQLSHKIVDELIRQGHQATEADFNMFELLEQNPSRLDLRVYDYILEVHFNITEGGAGTEIFVPKGTKAVSVEAAIMERLGKYFTKRKDYTDGDYVKEGDYWILKALKDRNIALLEVAFLDNDNDMKIYFENTDGIAVDIARGILEGFGQEIKTIIPVKADPIKGTKAPDGKLYRVGLGAYSNRENAEGVLQKAKTAGFEAYLTLIDDPRRT